MVYFNSLSREFDVSIQVKDAGGAVFYLASLLASVSLYFLAIRGCEGQYTILYRIPPINNIGRRALARNLKPYFSVFNQRISAAYSHVLIVYGLELAIFRQFQCGCLSNLFPSSNQIRCICTTCNKEK